MLSPPLSAGADVVVAVDDAALRANLLVFAPPAQFGQEHARLIVRHRTDRFLGDRDGAGRQPEMRGHDGTPIQNCEGAWEIRSMPPHYRSGYGVSELSSCYESNQKSGVRMGLSGQIGPV